MLVLSSACLDACNLTKAIDVYKACFACDIYKSWELTEVLGSHVFYVALGMWHGWGLLQFQILIWNNELSIECDIINTSATIIIYLT